MSGSADAWWDDLRQEAELPPPPPRRPVTPVVLAATAVALASGGLAWWLSSPREGARNAPAEAVRAQGSAARAAGAAVDAEQVRRAYEEVRLVYANSGGEGLARFSESCEQSLKGDPRILDFCLAFDLFADGFREGRGDVAGKAAARRLALVQAALPPGADPDARIAALRREMRRVSGAPAAPVQAAAAPAAPAAAAPPAPVRLTKAEPARPPAAKAQASAACRFGSTPADRLLCANPSLAAQHRRMRAAYERALEAGADPLVIDAAQAEWRAARNAADDRRRLSELYARRIRELEAAAKTPPRGEETRREEPRPDEPPV